MAELIIQGLIILFSCGAIWLLAQKGALIRWGYIVGMIGQPLWFYTTYTHGQWGMFLTTCWFTYCYYKGIKNYWLRW